jgi:hypothetical protein
MTLSRPSTGSLPNNLKIGAVTRSSTPDTFAAKGV